MIDILAYQLKQALKPLLPFAKKNSKAVLNHIRIVSDMETRNITFESSNLECYAKSTLHDVHVGQNLDILISSDILEKIIKSKEEMLLTIVDEETQTVNINGLTTNYLKSEEFVEFPHIAPKRDFIIYNLDNDAIDSMIRVASLPHYDANKRNLAAMCFQVKEDGCLTFVATDGHQLELDKISTIADFEVCKDMKLLLDRKILLNIFKNLPKTFENFHLIQDVNSEKTLLSFVDTYGISYSFVIVNTQGWYPDYEKIFPEKTGVSVYVNRKKFISALESCKGLITDMNRAFKLELLQNELKITANNPNIGECTKTIPCRNTENCKGFIGLNLNYVLAIAKSIDSEEIDIELQEQSHVIQSSPVYIWNPYYHHAINLIMPMKLSY